jgi:hypothetical protein
VKHVPAIVQEEFWTLTVFHVEPTENQRHVRRRRLRRVDAG